MAPFLQSLVSYTTALSCKPPRRLPLRSLDELNGNLEKKFLTSKLWWDEHLCFQSVGASFRLSVTKYRVVIQADDLAEDVFLLRAEPRSI